MVERMDEEGDDPADDPLEQIEALETRCNVLESVIALLAIELTRTDPDARGRIVDHLEMIENASRKRNVHDEGLLTMQRVRDLIEGAPEG